MISSKNLKKPPQCVVEGITPSTYGVVPTNPIFTARGQRSVISKSNENEFVDDDFGGHLDRQGKTKVREKNTLTYSSRLLETDIDILKWVFNTPNGAGTPDESRTWLDSYLDNAGTEIYRVWKGCKITTATLNITPGDFVKLEITMSAKSYIENSAHNITLGNGSFATAQATDTPLRFKDIGDLFYGDAQLNFRSCTITTVFTQKTQDSNGSETDLYAEQATRRTTGSVDIFKKNQNLNEEARAGMQKFGYLVIQNKSEADTTPSKRIPATGNNYITITPRIPGTFGNSYSIQLRTSSSNTRAELDGTKLLITVKRSGETLANIKSALEADMQVNSLFTSEITGNSSTLQSASVANSAFSGGIDVDTKFAFTRFGFLPSNEDLIDDSEATIESKSVEIDVIEVKSA